MGKSRLAEQRAEAVQRLVHGENPEAICASMKRSKSWLYKWYKRHLVGNDTWNQSRPHRPRRSPRRTSDHTEEVVKMVRLNLYNRGLFCGAHP